MTVPAMSARFDEAFRRTIGIEGRYSNNPKDNGGETIYGITKAVALEHGYVAPMKDMPLMVAKDIYHRAYWLDIRGDDLPEPLAFFVFDMAVNSGQPTAKKALQRALGVLPDGAIGPKTLAAVNTKNPREVVRLIFVERAKIYAHHEDRDEFENGWFARLFDVSAAFFGDFGKCHV